MSRHLAVAAFAGCVWFVAHAPARSDDAAAATVTDREAEGLVTKQPESIDAWEARRPALLGWLRSRLGEAPAKQPDWSVGGEAVPRDGCASFTLRRGETECGALLVPADHVGRGPAVVYFANGPLQAAGADKDKKSAELARSACEDLARSGYVVMLVHEAGRDEAAGDEAAGDEAGGTDDTARPDRSAATAATWQVTTHADLKGVEFLLARREVDPDRVAVLGVGAAARRAWWAAASDERLAAVVSLGTPESGTLEDQVLLSLIAPRPHRLALDMKRVDERQTAYRHWLAGPQNVYEWREVPRLFSTKVGAGFSSTSKSPAWQDTLRWLKDEL